jgi:hypothetical protein
MRSSVGLAVFALEVSIVRQDVFDATPGADLTHNHADGHTHAPDAWLTAHDGRVLGDAI